MLYIFEDNEAVIKMIIKGRGPTELRLIGCLTESTQTPKSKYNMLKPKTNSKTYSQRAISHVMSGTIFSSVQYQHLQLSLLHQKDVENNAINSKRRENCGKVEAEVRLGLVFCGSLSNSAELECIQSPGDSQSTQTRRFESHSTMCWETSRLRFKSK